MFADQNAPHYDDTLGGRISLARGVKAISAKEAAQQLGVLPSSWNAWECDRDTPRVNRLTMMAGILGVSPTWLLTGHGNGPLDHTADHDRGDLLQAIREISDDLAALDRRMRVLSRRFERDAMACEVD
jgi:transcriptional regulator with XRE-family HTH domain